MPINSQIGTSGALSYKPGDNEGLVPKTVEFLRTQLPSWRDDPDRPSKTGEKSLNSSLCDFLDTRARSILPMVRFKHEDPQVNASIVDIGVHGADEITVIGVLTYTKYVPFLVVECKRLPTPGKTREREYVSGANPKSGGATGGIQRFKLGLHGAGVEAAVMVAYVEKESVQHWHLRINEWIGELAAASNADGCTWSLEDQIQPLAHDKKIGTANAISNHQRIGECLTGFIVIHHLWVVMKRKKR